MKDDKETFAEQLKQKIGVTAIVNYAQDISAH